MIKKALKIDSAKYLGSIRIEFKFNDGHISSVDFLPFLQKSENASIKKYLNEDYFKKFKLKDGDVMWGDFDLIFPIYDLYKNNLIHTNLQSGSEKKVS